MTLDITSKFVTLGVFGAVGWALAQRWRLPVAAHTWLLLVVAALAGAFAGETRVVCLNGIGICIYLNWAIASCCLGILGGLWLRARASLQGARSGDREP